ncbi:hypothetical protein TKK_0005210 [Trichogramma kaykai]|uniref:C2H2-type domain-containing protein n=1 Tax=Trichogramma kaykai TaxID=54128 RepID=A0ABD2XKZ5_9HYME
MNFSEHNNAQSSLPQFSEISIRSVTTSNFASNDNHHLHSTQDIIYTAAADSNNVKQAIINSHNKYSTNTILNWADTNALVQICEKQGLQALNIPTYTQNNATLNVQSHNLPMRIIPNVYIQQATESAIDKDDGNNIKVESDDIDNQQNLLMAEYIQRVQSSIPITLQQLIKIQSDHVKKEKADEHKNDQIQNNILNIPSVYKNVQIQNDGQFLSTDHPLLTLTQNDVNVHVENQAEASSSQTQVQNHLQSQTQNSNKPEQNEAPKPEKKIKFRAKTGEIKVTTAIDGSTLYCCPECNLAFSDKTEIEQHLQVHVQERKYQCKECGAMLKRKEHLDQHMRGHSDERPFKCPVCTKAFKRNEHLTRHYVIHSGDKNFTCSVCQKAFSRKDHLNKHAQTHLGIKKTKANKKEVTNTEVPVSDAGSTTTTTMLIRPDLNSFFKDNGSMKQETTNLLQHIQNLHKDTSLLHTFSAFKERMLHDGAVLQQPAVNMSEILPQNTRYLMPS